MERPVKIQTQFFKTPLGELILGSYQDQLCLCDWRYRNMRPAIDQRIRKGLHAGFEAGESSVIKQTKEQLNNYFKREQRDFQLPLLMLGTPFQKSVWEELLKIPYGKTESYLGLAHKLHNEKAIRAVAAANGANALSIVVPCHRVIGSHAALVGYDGGLVAKEKLLQLEGARKPDAQLGLF